MTDDQIKAFFEREREAVPLLPAPPGHVEELQSLARSRRNRNTTVVSVAAAVVLAVAGTGLVLSTQGAGNRTGQVAGQSLLPSVNGTPAPTTPAAPVVPVPSGFVVSSMSFAHLADGFALGHSPCGGDVCADLVATTDGMTSWHLTKQFDAATSHSAGLTSGGLTMRFASTSDGWIVGRTGVLATHDGGSSWHAVAALAGGSVRALEVSNGVIAYATEADGSVWVDRNVLGDEWTRAADPGLGGDGTDSIMPVNITLAVSRTVGSSTQVRFSENRGADWVTVKLPCDSSAGPAPIYALIDEGSARVICGNGKSYRMTPTGGKARVEGVVKPRVSSGGSATATSVTVTGSETVAAYGDGGLVATFDKGKHWSEVQRGSFGYVGMTNDTRGFALAAQPSSRFWATTDGGRTWGAQSFR